MSLSDHISTLVNSINIMGSNITGRINLLAARLRNHANATGNVHSLTKADLGLSRVENMSPARLMQARNVTTNNAVMTPLRTGDAIQAQVYTPMVEIVTELEDYLNS